MFLHLWFWVSYDSNYDKETEKPTAIRLLDNDMAGASEGWKGDNRRCICFSIQIFKL